MGWTDELKADKLFADYGYVMIPFISVENMTVMSSFPSVQGTPIEPKPTRPIPTRPMWRCWWPTATTCCIR